ncbi:MAG: serine/threonine-protein kinase, partial [Gemmatimonadota bacterium]
MSETRTCHRCGTEVEGNALFCSRCGQDMTLLGDEQETLTVTTAGTPIEPVRSTMRQALRDATLGEYEILSELGRGGMATVFLAHDISLDRKVAIKVMAPHLLEGEGMAERFKLEARTAAQLSHPHIIPIYAVKETAETLFFVMKFVEGRGLDSVIKKSGQLPIPMVTDILTKVGSALGYAHRRDVVHRDIKPGNIMIDDEGTPIVTDFGIAKVAEAKGLTVTGTTIGTPSYMSPEQCEAREVTGASDQYSLGIVAFEMLTGKLPFEGDSAVTTMYKHCHEPLPPLEDFRPDCPPELRET